MNDKDHNVEIQKSMRRENAFFLAIFTLFGAAVIIEYWLGVDGLIFWWTIVMTVAVGAIAILRNLMVPRWLKNWPKYVQDERMKKINASASSRAFIVAQTIVVIIMLLALFKIVDLGTYPSLIIVYLAMIYSWLAFKWYYGRKGDVE